MQVGFTISGSIEVPDGTPLDKLRDVITKELTKEMLPSLRTTGLERPIQAWLDKNIVEYDVLGNGGLAETLDKLTKGDG
jgi:hypothetical protein